MADGSASVSPLYIKRWNSLPWSQQEHTLYFSCSYEDTVIWYSRKLVRPVRGREEQCSWKGMAIPPDGVF